MTVVCVDPFAQLGEGAIALGAPPSGFIAITPSDTNDVATRPTSTLFCLTHGDVEVITADGQTVIIPDAYWTAFKSINLRVTRVKATGTVGTGIYATLV